MEYETMALIEKLLNEDGTVCEPPSTPEYEALKAQHPGCGYGGYNCMFCSGCLRGDYYKPTPEEREILAVQGKITNDYLMAHNESFRT